MKKAAAIFGRSHSPLYAQVASVMRQRIESGVWAVGDKISTLDELEKEFGVARVTIRQGIEMLSNEGLLNSQQGRGTFVSGKPKRNRWFNVATDLETTISSLRENVLRRAEVKPHASRPDLDADEGELADEYTFIRSVQYNKGEPFSVVNVFLDSRIYRRDPAAFSNEAAIPLIADMEDITITHAHQTLTIGVADQETAELLKIGLGEPTADCRLIFLDQDQKAIYVANIHYIKSCFALRMDLLQKSGPRAGRRAARKVAPAA